MRLGAADRTLACPYCRVRHHIVWDGPPCLVLRSRGAYSEAPVHLPYWRIRGAVLSCRLDATDVHSIDRTERAAGCDPLPRHLGVRPQAIPLAIAREQENATFLATDFDARQALAAAIAEDRAIEADLDPPLYRLFLGESISIVHLPLIRERDGLRDGVTEKLLPGAALPDPLRPAAPSRVSLLPMLCPNCGGDLDATPDAIVLPCLRCGRAWRGEPGGLLAVPFEIPEEIPPGALLLPFWTIEMEPAFRDAPARLLLPAFRVHPRLYLRLAATITLARDLGSFVDGGTVSGAAIARATSHPPNLPSAEAREAIPVLLAEICRPRLAVLDALPRLSIGPSPASLRMLAFVRRGPEWTHESLPVALRENQLRFGRNL